MSTSTDTKKRCKNCLEYLNIYTTCFKCDAPYHTYCWEKMPGAYVNKRGQLFCCSSLTLNCAATNANLETPDNPPERVIEKRNVDDHKEELGNLPIKQEDFEWNEFKCDACHLEFTNKELLENQCSACPNKEEEFIQTLKEDKDLENCPIKQEDSEWNELKCDTCHLEFTNKEYFENHCSECPNKKGEFIQALKENKDLENCLHKEEDLECSEFRCGACLLEFANKEHLINHYNECPNEEREFIQELKEDKAGLFCSFCNEEHFQKESYEQHIKQCPVESSCSRLNKNNCIYITNTKRNPAQVADKEENYKHTVCNYSTHIKECAVKCTSIPDNEKSFKCDMCDYPAKENETLNSHFSLKHFDRKEQHDSGVYVFSTPLKDAFGGHQQIDISERLFKCDWCDYTAAQGINLKIHIKSKHSNGDKKYKCTDCKYSTDIKVNLVNHIRTHTNEKPFQCDMCDYAAAMKQTLKSHVLAKHSNAAKKYKCKDCKFSTHTKATLVKHVRTHTNEKPFKCDMCDYAVGQRQNLKNHVLSKHSNAAKKYKCKDCIYSTHTKRALVRHVPIHTNEKPFKCNLCDYGTAESGTLKRHVLTKHSNADKEYKCTDCKYSAHRKTDLVNHIRTHTNEKPFKCNMCDYAAVKGETLKMHVLTKHSNAVKKYKCKDCPFSTHTKATLVKHVRTHTNEKPFQCDMCDYAAAQKSCLNNHVLRKHSNADKKYKCRDCAYSAYRKTDLANHIHTHTNEKPFKCNMCDYAAARNDSLNVHILAKHSNVHKEYK